MILGPAKQTSALLKWRLKVQIVNQLTNSSRSARYSPSTFFSLLLHPHHHLIRLLSEILQSLSYSPTLTCHFLSLILQYSCVHPDQFFHPLLVIHDMIILV